MFFLFVGRICNSPAPGHGNPMKSPIGLALLSLLASSTHAYAGASTPNSLTMTCVEAQHYIVLNDGAVLATGGAYASFHSSYCSGQPAFVRTKDAKYCFVGQYCDCETTYCAQSYFQGANGLP